MLFSSTLVAEASQNINYQKTFSVPLVATDTGTLIANGGVISTRNIANYSYHFKIPFKVTSSWTEGGSADTLYRVLIRWNGSNPVSTSEGSVSNVGVYDSEGNLIISSTTAWDDNKVSYMYGNQIHSVVDGQDFGVQLPYVLEFDWTYSDTGDFGGIDFSSRESFTLNVYLKNFNIYIQPASSEEIASNTPKVTESNSQQIKESTEAIEESVTSDTGGGILATIKNFFGSFFQNVFDTLVSVFVPEDGFFSDWFNRLNTLLSEKLGMLYAPFDLLITTLNAIMNADTTDTGIPFPGIQWEDTWLVEPFTFYFSSLGDTFTELQRYVYFGTDTVLLFAFLHLLQQKIRLILEGSESG